MKIKTRGHSLHNPHRATRGTAMVMILVLSVVLTALVLTIAWTAGTQAQITGSTIHLDQANAAAESAGQWAVWQFKHNNTWRQSTTPATLPSLAVGNNSYNYAVTAVDAGAAATLYWPFSEGTGLISADTSGHNNTGQLIGGVSWTTGRYGQALLFDGVTGYVDAGNNASTNIVSSVTMAAWVKMNSAGQDQKVGGNQDGNAGGYKMSIYGLRVEFEVRDASNNYSINRFVSGGTILTMGVWYHVTGVYDQQNGTIKTYVNGYLDRTVTGVSNTALASTQGHFLMGREPWILNGSTRFFNGVIDDVRVYDRALSDQEVRTLADNSVHVHTFATLANVAGSPPSSSAFDFICSAPTPASPVAPAITVGGNLPMNKSTVTGDVQVSGSITGVAASSITGRVTYGSSLSDPQHYITVNYQGATTSATQNASASVPTIDYNSIQSQATATPAAGTNQTYSFVPTYNGKAAVIYVNGDVTDPIIDTSSIGGTILIKGNLTITKNASWGSSGFPANVVVQKSVIHSGGLLSLVGGLYVKKDFTHTDCNITGDVCVGGDVTDNTTSSSVFVVGGIPWFDPRSAVAPTPVSMYYTTYEGVSP